MNVVKRSVAVLFLLNLGFYAPQVSAQEVAEVAETREIVGRFEIDAFVYDVSLNNMFVQHPYAFHLTVGYHFLDWLSLEVQGGYALVAGETALTTLLRSDPADLVRVRGLSGLWQTTWSAGSNLVFSPIYGKVALFSYLQSHFQVYGMVPIVAEGVTRIVAGASNENAARIAVGLGGGVRFFALDQFVLRAEVKHMYGVNPALPDGGTDISSTTWLQLGVGYLL